MTFANRTLHGQKQMSNTRKRRALTLVELLVTVSIMGMVVAISVPIIKPMLASNKVKSGADVVAGFLAQARNRAIEENRPVGVTFERVLNYQDGDAYPYNGVSVLMRQVAEPRPLSGFVKDVRVAVDASSGAGQIFFYTWQWNSSAGVWEWALSNAEADYWKKLVFDGDQIQFNANGPKYKITRTGDVFSVVMNDIQNPNFNLTPPVYTNLQPALFKVFRKPQPGKIAPTMAMPVALPSGVVVDLDCSGMKTSDFIDKSKSKNWRVVCDDFSASGPEDKKSVTIMFSPTGEVDRVYFSEPGTIKVISTIPTGPIFLNIGIWERSGFWMEDTTKPQNSPDRWYISNDYLPDDDEPDLRNYHDMNNYWVTIFSRTGAVRVNRVATTPDSGRFSDGAINTSRRLAESLHNTETN